MNSKYESNVLQYELNIKILVSIPMGNGDNNKYIQRYGVFIFTNIEILTIEYI